MDGPSKVEVWLTDLKGRGHEQKQERPGIIWRDLDHVKMAIAIPCTSAQDKTKYPYTYLISPTTKNGLSEDSVALVFQLTSVDKTRLIRKLGELDAEDISGIGPILKEMLRI
jgi:mRNA-degrading endonuclease toxin of MazEF toxin-antitoxin module